MTKSRADIIKDHDENGHPAGDLIRKYSKIRLNGKAQWEYKCLRCNRRLPYGDKVRDKPDFWDNIVRGGTQ